MNDFAELRRNINGSEFSSFLLVLMIVDVSNNNRKSLFR